MDIKTKSIRKKNYLPFGGSFSYLVSLDVLKTPFIFTAARKSHASKRYTTYRHSRTKELYMQTYEKPFLPERSDNGKK